MIVNRPSRPLPFSNKQLPYKHSLPVVFIRYELHEKIRAQLYCAETFYSITNEAAYVFDLMNYSAEQEDRIEQTFLSVNLWLN